MEKTIKVLGINPKSTDELSTIPSEIIIRQELHEKLDDFPEWFVDYIIQSSTKSNEWERTQINKPVLNKDINITNLVPVLIKRLLSFCLPVIKIDFVSKSTVKDETVLESNIPLDAVNAEFVNYRIASNDLVKVVGLYVHMLEKNAIVPIYKNIFKHFREDADIRQISDSGLYSWIDANGAMLLLGPSSNKLSKSSKYVWDDLSIEGLESLTKDLYKMTLWGYRNATLMSRVYSSPLVDKSLTQFYEPLDFGRLSKFWDKEIIQHITMDKSVLNQIRRIFPIPKNKETDIMQLSSIYNLNSLVESIYLYGLSHPINVKRLQLLEGKLIQTSEVIAQKKVIFKSQLDMIYSNKYAKKLFDLPYDKLNVSQQTKIQKQLALLGEHKISQVVSKIFDEMRLAIINFYNDKSAIIQIKKKVESIFRTKTTVNDLYPLMKTSVTDPDSNSELGILCPHWVDYLDAILALRPRQQNKESTTTVYNISDARDPIVKKWGSDDSSRNDGRWCKTCGEKLQEIKDEAVDVNNQEFWSTDGEDNHIQQLLWSELQNSTKFLKFSSSQGDPFRIIDYLITTLTPYVKHVYLEIQKNKTLNENESKAYLSIYASMYVYSALAKLIIENPNMEWNIVVKKSRSGGGDQYLIYKDGDGVTGGRKDNKLIITQSYSIVLSIKRSLIDNIAGMSMEKFKALFLEIFNVVYGMDGISFNNVSDTFAETSNEPDSKYNYILGMNPIYHYAYQEAMLFSGKPVGYTDLLKILGTDTPRKWSLMNSTKKAETLPIYNHPTDKTKYEDIFNLDRMYEVDKFKTGSNKSGGKSQTRVVIAKTAPKKNNQGQLVTNNAFELYVDFFKDEIHKEYLHADSKPLMEYYDKIDQHRQKYEKPFDVAKYMKFLPHAVYNKPYNNTFKKVTLKEKSLSSTEKAKRIKSQAFNTFRTYCPFFLPKKQGHTYKTGNQVLLPHESELDYLKPAKCIKCGWGKLFIEEQPDVWYKKWSTKMIPKKTEVVNLFNRKNDIYKWDSSDKFPIWKVNTTAILKLSKISGLSNNFWDNLGFMENFEFDQIMTGKANPSKSISDDRIDQAEQRMLLDRTHKIDNHVMWVYTRLMNIKFFNNVNYEDTLNDPTVTEILKANKTKNLETNIKDPIPNYRSQLNWYYLNQPNIKTMNFAINQLSTILLYINGITEYKYLSSDFFKYCIQHIKATEMLTSKMNLGKYYANLMKANDSIFGDDAEVPNVDAIVGDYDSFHPNRDEDPNRNDESNNPEGKDTELGFNDNEIDDSDPFSYEHTSFDGLNDGGDDANQNNDDL